MPRPAVVPVASCSAARRHSIASNGDAPGSGAHGAPGNVVVVAAGMGEVDVEPFVVVGVTEVEVDVEDVAPGAVDEDEVVAGDDVVDAPVVGGTDVVPTIAVDVVLLVVELVVVGGSVSTAKRLTEVEDRAVV